ncbi:nitroreductase [Rhodococcus opacus]|uniref:nitroreductase n=1 Tax=Rhodococcus opacus TaxID=37919 RepID=UPI00146EB175|nr:nitroreductase [Rhodococcus opacus]MDJ0415370.1 nitroreductase [Rhodococcus opacus]MDV7090941.1 nitroreductase [Rhodococcus opacus]UNN04695.1 nitroreductase [Rhodococcus opacus]WKN52492.1 nitroreductase [Rhodococcus opacus]
MSTTDVNRAAVLRELMVERWSCRSYLDKPVTDDVLDELLAMAQRSPSWCNSQPWHVTVIRGDRLDDMREKFVRHAESHTEAPDLPFPLRYEGVYRERRRECGWQLYDSVGIQKGDREASQKQAMENFRFFGAPALAIITTEADLGTYGAIDCGVYIGNFLLAAQSLGLATIPQAALASHSGFLRGELQLPDHRKVVAGVSFGYADENDPANGFRTNRADIAESSTRVGS